MDLLNKAYAQLADLFRSMTPGARITAGLLLVTILVSLVYLFRYHSEAADEYLFGGRAFSDRELTQMEAAFAKKGLNGWARDGQRVRVPRGQRFTYLAALADDNALPADFGSIMDEMLANSSPFDSRQQRDLKIEVARERHISLIVAAMKGVEDATVQYSEEERPGLAREKEKRALVAVRSTNGRELDEMQIESIRHMSAAGFPGLDPEKVTVADLDSGRTYVGKGPDGTGIGGESAYVLQKRELERDYKRKILDMLSMVRGVVVAVDVQLNPELRRTTQTMEYRDPKSISSADYEKTVATETPLNSGRPGAVPNATLVGNQPQEVGQAMAKSDTTERRNEQRNIAGQHQQMVEMAPLYPSRVDVSVSVPTTYIEQVWLERWRQQNPTNNQPPAPDPQQLQAIELEIKSSIETRVAQVLPKQQGEDPFPRVAFTTYTPIPGPAPEPVSVADTALSWLGAHWPTLGMILLGVGSLLMLRSMIRSTAGSPDPAAATMMQGDTGEADQDEAEEEARQNALRAMRVGGPNLRDELTELVREDPDSAANVLRAWIGDAA